MSSPIKFSRMKRIYVIFTVFSLLLISCEFEHDQMGLPKSIYFPPDGGTQTVKGNIPYLRHIIIYDKNGNQNSSPWDTDTLVTGNDWLTVKHIRHTDSIIVSAKPTSSPKKREIWIEPWTGTTYALIKVTQQG